MELRRRGEGCAGPSRRVDDDAGARTHMRMDDHPMDNYRRSRPPTRPCVSAVRQYADESGRRYCKNKLRDHAFSKLNRRDLKSRTRLWTQSQERDASGQIKTAELVKYRRC